MGAVDWQANLDVVSPFLIASSKKNLTFMTLHLEMLVQPITSTICKHVLLLCVYIYSIALRLCLPDIFAPRQDRTQ